MIRLVLLKIYEYMLNFIYLNFELQYEQINAEIITVSSSSVYANSYFYSCGFNINKL